MITILIMGYILLSIVTFYFLCIWGTIPSDNEEESIDTITLVLFSIFWPVMIIAIVCALIITRIEKLRKHIYNKHNKL